MSILIKGMEMPNSCGECLFICKESTCRYGKGYERADFCPLVEVKPHGRLIDADALLKSISRAIEDDPDIADVYEEDYESVNDWLASAPTIIEAEEGE